MESGNEGKADISPEKLDYMVDPLMRKCVFLTLQQTVLLFL